VDAKTLAAMLGVTRARVLRRTYISIALIANNFDVKWVMAQPSDAMLGRPLRSSALASSSGTATPREPPP
jgi:hypothetical protein